MRLPYIFLVCSLAAAGLAYCHIPVPYVVAAVSGFCGGVVVYYRLYYSNPE